MTRPLSFAEYTARSGISQSALKPILTSPAHYQHSLKSPRKDTPALRFGRAADVAAFEPHRFALDFAVAPSNDDGAINRRTKVGKAQWQTLLDANAGKTLLSADEHNRAWIVGEVARTHPVTRDYMTRGEQQVIIEWTDKATGIRCKGRADIVNDAIVDLKSTLSVDKFQFGRDMAKWLYHFQGAFYRTGWHEMTGEWLDFVDVAVEKFEPFDAGAFTVTGDWLQRGNELVRQALDTYARCRDAGQWPGRYSAPIEAVMPRSAMPWEEGADFEIINEEAA